MVTREAVLVALEALRVNVPDGYGDSSYYTMGWEDALDAACEAIEGWDEDDG